MPGPSYSLYESDKSAFYLKNFYEIWTPDVHYAIHLGFDAVILPAWAEKSGFEIKWSL